MTGASSDTPSGLLAGQLASDPARPLVTYYDDAAGGRVELSVATLANWVAKTANFLADGLGVVAGDRVAVGLPLHWQSAGILLGCWAVGAVVTDDGASARVGFTAATDLTRAGDADEVVALSGTPLGGPAAGLPVGVLDYAVEVPGYGDRYAAAAPRHGGDPALELAGRAISAGELVAVSAVCGLAAGDRLLTVTPYDEVDAVVTGLVGPLAVGASVVLCANVDAAALPARVTEERVTVTVGLDVPGVRRLDR